eukprot:Skav225254  [mRNA]  locus=scaffold988:115213:117893:- [translate_table: standard]
MLFVSSLCRCRCCRCGCGCGRRGRRRRLGRRGRRGRRGPCGRRGRRGRRGPCGRRGWRDEDSDDDPAICQAAEAGDIAAVRHLIRVDSGAVRRTHENGWTAMHCAAAKGHAEVLSALAKAGGDVEAEGGGRREPRELRRLRDHRRDATRPRGVADAAPAAELLELGAAVAPKDCNGDTPLHKSAFYGRVEVAKLLLAARAPLDTKNGNGQGPRWDGLSG